jgi:uncharacterized protein YoxC
VLLLVVWIAVAVIALVVLGGLLYSVHGALRRLQHEVAAVQRDLQPVLERAQRTLEAAARQSER